MKTIQLSLTAILSLTLAVLISACSGGSGELSAVNPNAGNNANNSGGGGGGNQTNPSTAKMTVTIKDAPLADLQSLTIDVSEVVLKGNGVNDVTVFPAMQGTTGSVTVDLLSLQGLNQILSSRTVPAGDYYALEMTYANPSATDSAGVAQNITTVGSRITGILSPVLSVTGGNNMGLQVDLDLQRSYTDLGGNNGFLAPVIVVNVINQPVPLRRFPAIVGTIDLANDRFEADLAFFGSGAPQAGNSGSVSVQCDTQTTFVDGMGNVSTGNVTANLQSGDLVEIDGSLMGSDVLASSVARFATTQPGGGNVTPGANPPVIDLSGTIMATDPMTNTIEIMIDAIAGPPNVSLPQTFTTMTLDITATTALHRGPMAQSLGDFVPGNYCYAFAQAGTSAAGSISFEALDVDEFPALVTGTVDAITAGAGQMGADLLDFTPSRVNQLPMNRVPFVPTPLKTDVPSGFGAQQGDTVSIFGFFDGTDYLQSVGGSLGNPTTRPPMGGGTTGGGNGGGGNPGGGTGSPNPTVQFSGTVQSGTQASLLTAGGVIFTLDVGNAAQPLTVTVSPNASMSLVDMSQQSYTLTAAQAVAVLNAQPTAVSVEGNTVPQNQAFLADIELVVYGDPNAIPPSNGGGNTGGGGPRVNDVAIGSVVGQARLVSSAARTTIQFSMIGAVAPSTQPQTFSVTVGPNAQLTQLANGQPQTVTPQQAVSALNASPISVQVEGDYDAQQASFDCHTALTITPRGTGNGGGGNPGGGNGGGGGVNVPDVAVGTVVGRASLGTFGNATGITFTMTGAVAPSTQPVTFTVNVSPNAVITLDTRAGAAPRTLTLQEALVELNNNPSSVQVIGDYDAQSATFDCNVSLTITR